MPLPATEINKELCDWARKNLTKIPKDEDMDYYDKKISGVLVKPPQMSHLQELVIKQKARDFYDLKMYDFETPQAFVEERKRLTRELLGKTNGSAFIEAPVYFNFGYNVAVGRNFYANFNCTFLDWSVIRIGDDVAIGPNCTLTTVNHPLDCDDRHNGLYSYPITIQNGVWIGANCTILSNVTIGEGSVIAAGSTVTHDIPAHVVAAGSPARVKARSKGRNALPEEVDEPPLSDAANTVDAANSNGRGLQNGKIEPYGHTHTDRDDAGDVEVPGAKRQRQ